MAAAGPAAAATVTPDEVLRYTAPTDGYLCKPSANVYGIDFVYFRIRDMASNRVVFEVRKPEPPPGMVYVEPDDGDNSWRCIKYKFPKEFLAYQTVGTTLEFRVGPQPVPEFRMIERHYFHDRLVQSYDFQFGFCIPNSVNTWEAIYPMPKLSSDIRQAMIAEPYAVKSDSFYFVGNTLIKHNKAEYCYE